MNKMFFYPCTFRSACMCNKNREKTLRGRIFGMFASIALSFARARNPHWGMRIYTKQIFWHYSPSVRWKGTRTCFAEVKTKEKNFRRFFLSPIQLWIIYRWLLWTSFQLERICFKLFVIFSVKVECYSSDNSWYFTQRSNDVLIYLLSFICVNKR